MIRKKGASRFVNTVLLIAFIIALLLIVFLWGKNYLEELAQKRGALSKTELECQDVEVSIQDFSQSGPGKISLTLENKGKKNIHKFTVRIIGETIHPVEIAGVENKLSQSEIKKYDGDYLEYPEDEIGTLSKVEIIPWLRVVPGKYVPCTKQKATRNA